MRYLFVLILSCFTTGVFAQQFTFQLAPGFGTVIGSSVDDSRSGRVSFSMSGYYAINDRFSVGPEIIWTGRIQSPFSLLSTIDPVTGIQALEPASNNSSSKFLKFNYFSASQDNFRLFASVGVGMNTFKFKVGGPDGPEVLAKQNNFAFSPEVGAQLTRNLVISMRYIYGGDTPRFNGQDPNNESVEYSLESVTLNPILFSLKYQFHIGKQK